MERRKEGRQAGWQEGRTDGRKEGEGRKAGREGKARQGKGREGKEHRQRKKENERTTAAGTCVGHSLPNCSTTGHIPRALVEGIATQTDIIQHSRICRRMSPKKWRVMTCREWSLVDTQAIPNMKGGNDWDHDDHGMATDKMIQ
jgi:hypothetical protein